MMYKFKDGDKEMEVALERWTWGVVYKDGTELKQFDEHGVFHRIGEIDQDNIAMAVLFKPDEMETKRIDIPWQDGMQLIHKYRNIVFGGREGDSKYARVYIFGYKLGDQYHFNYILPDDRIIMSPVDNVKLSNFEI